MKSKILLFTFVFSIIFILYGAKKEKIEESWVEINPIKYVTYLEKVEQEFNLAFPMGQRIYSSSIYTNESSRINYANIAIDDSTKVYSENNRIKVDIPLIAQVSYAEWKIAFGKKYSRDTVLKDVKITLKLETELKINKEKDLSAETNIRVELKNQVDILTFLKGIKLFGKEGKLVTNFQRIILRNSEVKR